MILAPTNMPSRMTTLPRTIVSTGQPIDGKKMQDKRTPYIRTTKGQRCLNNSSIDMRATPQITNSTTPTGGVSMPITRL